MFGLASHGFARSAAATSVETYTWLRGGSPYVVHYVVKNGGHAVPQRTFSFPRALGETNHDLDMPAKAVELFLGPPT